MSKMSKVSKIELWQTLDGGECGDFEIVVQVRHYDGTPTGRTKSFRNDDASKIASFWHSVAGRPKHKKRKHDKLPTADEAKKLLQQINSTI